MFCRSKGGEAFIYKDLDILLDYLSDKRNIGMVQIATNGMHIPKDWFWNLTKEMNITVRISKYKPDKVKKFEELCQAKGVNAEIYSFCNEDDTWNSLGNSSNPYILAEGETVESRYHNCMFKGCLTMENGIIARCSRAVNAAKIQGFSHKNGDVLDIRKSKDIKKDFFAYYTHPHSMTACLYCKGSRGEKIMPAEQL